MCVKYLNNNNNNNNNNNTVFQMVKIGVAWANFVETAGIYLYHNTQSLYQFKNN